MKALLVVHPTRPEAREVVARLAVAAPERGIDVVEADSGRHADADLVIAVGGDGTVLAAVRLALQNDIPVLGFNVGHIGYLTAADPPEIDAVLDVLAAGDCEQSSRMTITATWDGGTATGLNDVVLEKVVSQHAVHIGMEVEGRHFTTYRADGVVVATPTGSTAYAFSAGGPMLDPELEALVVTPVAAHNLFAPTVLFSSSTTLTFTANAGRATRINIDGRQVAVLEPGERVAVQRGARRARFLMPHPRPFDQVVREKFRLDEG